MLSLTEMFAALGAPLTNQRWSWGAERQSDGAIVLRVWQDECSKIEGHHAVRITATEYFEDKPNNLGNTERLKHVELIRAGRTVYLVMCAAVDTKVEPRAIAHFNDKEVFVGGRLFDHEGDAWVELQTRKPVSELLPNKSLKRSRDG